MLLLIWNSNLVGHPEFLFAKLEIWDGSPVLNWLEKRQKIYLQYLYLKWYNQITNDFNGWLTSDISCLNKFFCFLMFTKACFIKSLTVGLSWRHRGLTSEILLLQRFAYLTAPSTKGGTIIAWWGVTPKDKQLSCSSRSALLFPDLSSILFRGFLLTISAPSHLFLTL